MGTLPPDVVLYLGCVGVAGLLLCVVIPGIFDYRRLTRMTLELVTLELSRVVGLRNELVGAGLGLLVADFMGIYGATHGVHPMPAEVIDPLALLLNLLFLCFLAHKGLLLWFSRRRVRFLQAMRPAPVSLVEESGEDERR